MSNKYLQVKNYKFTLLPREKKTMRITYLSNEVQSVVIPGKL